MKGGNTTIADRYSQGEKKKAFPATKTALHFKRLSPLLPSNYSWGPIILELFGGLGVFALAFQRCVSDSTAQTGTRQKSKEPVCLASPTAVRRLITSQCPLTRSTHGASTAPQRKSAPCSAPTEAPWLQGPGLMVPTGHRPLGPGCPGLPRDGSARGCHPLSL